MKDLTKVLIANRGEIASRIAKTLHKMNIKAYGLYIDEEKNAPYLSHLDHCEKLVPNTLQAFLDMEAILEAAKRCSVDAIHPGYGFLSESAVFAQKVCDAGLIWIGPAPLVIEQLGDKNQAKAMAKQAGLSTLPSVFETKENDSTFEKSIQDLTLPLIIKPMMGGGGKGMQILHDFQDLSEKIEQSRRVAKSAFGDSRLLAESFMINPRHIEVQVVRDTHGNAYSLGERDCTIQRRHQKIIEEAPSAMIDEDQRKTILKDAITLSNFVEYTSVGTIEFLLDQKGKHYFMEANTRLQVEHPVTEMIYDVDLVEMQIQIAQGQPIKPILSDPQGHAIEVRLYAENTDQNFRPSTGTITNLNLPEENAWTQVHHNLQNLQHISSFFDPMLCKLVVWGQTRLEAITELLAQLSQIQIAGVHTNQTYVSWVLQHPDFQNANHHTQWVDQTLNAFLFDREKNLDRAVRIWQYHQWEAHQSHWALDPWNSYEPKHTPQVENLVWNEQAIPNQYLTTRVDPWIDQHEMAQIGSQSWIFFENHVYVFEDKIEDLASQGQMENHIKAPMAGTIVKIYTSAGQSIAKDQVVIEMEAMKMQYKLISPKEGKVQNILCKVADVVQSNQTLVEFAP